MEKGGSVCSSVMFNGKEILDRLPTFLRDMYETDFRAADEAFRAGRLEETTRKRETYWEHWLRYCLPLGVDPHLSVDTTPYQTRARVLTGFAARVRTGYYGRGREVKAATTASAITAIGQTISLDSEVTLDGWRKDDPPTTKKLPVEVDVPEYLADVGRQAHASPLQTVVGDLSLIAFYYLLRVGEYTISTQRSNSKQTKQFKICDITFFKVDDRGRLRQLPRDASNGWKGVCIHQEANGDCYLCPVRALGRRYTHIRNHTSDKTTFLSAVFTNGGRMDVTSRHISEGLKLAAAALDYPSCKGIPIDRIDTHSLRCGGANALSLAGYSDRQIQKMGRWRSATFMEYIKESLFTFLAGMSRSMKQKFNFFSVEGGVLHDITNVVVNSEYSVSVSTAVAA
eukprot:scaffold18565_cov71-Skeletonema_dohrnii-CCMP3373.AAC.3